MKEDSSSNTSIAADGISEANFFQLLRDKIFVDYFNVFLMLPVFEQHVIYKSFTDEFEFDPPVKSAKPNVQVDRTRTLKWLYTVRLPLFLKTNLYLEYKLCRKLIAPSSNKSSDTNLQQPLPGCGDNADRFEDAVGHVTGMRQFRQYLDEGPGRKLLRLWLDVERFFAVPATDPMLRWMTFREIQMTFYDFDSCTTHWQDIDGLPCVLLDAKGFAEVQCFQFVPNPTMTEKEVNAFIADTYSDQKHQQLLQQHEQQQQQQGDVSAADDSINLSSLRTLQKLLLRVLRDYWLSKWLLHRQTDQWLCSSPKDNGHDEMEEEEENNERDGIYEEENDETSVEQLKTEIDKMIKGDWPEQKRAASSPNVVVGAVNDALVVSPENNEVITIEDDGNVTLSAIDPTVSSKVVMTSKIERAMDIYLSKGSVDGQAEPSIASTSKSHSNVSLVPKSSDSNLSVASGYGSVSTVSSTCLTRTQQGQPVSTAARKSMVLSGTKKRPKDVPDPNHLMRLKIVELRKLTAECEELSSFTVRRLSKPSATSISSTTSSTRLTDGGGVICRKHSKPLLATEPPEALTTGGYRDDQQSFLRGIVADRLAGGPFEAYLVMQGCDESRRILNFWRDAQVYLSCKGLGETSIQAYMRCRRAKVLVTRYLTGHADKRMCVLAPALRYSLQRHLAIGKGDELMRRAQDVAVESLRPMWQAYLKNDTVTFQNSVVAVRRELYGFTLKTKADRTAPKYFQAQERLDQDGQRRDSETEDPVMLERARSYEAARRTELALQFTIDMSEFCLDDLLVENYPESEIRLFPDTLYGSLAVKKFRIVHRPDIVLEMRRKKFLDQLAWIRKPSIDDHDHEDDLESIQSSIRPFMRGSKVITRPGKPSSCNAIFEDPTHMEFFQRYLVAMNADITPLLFYLDVDTLKEIHNPVKQKEKVQEILNTFFKSIESVKKLKCESRVLETIHYLPKQTTAEMLSVAQSSIRRCLIDRWCAKYMKTFDEEEQAKKEERREATYELWRKFLRGVNKVRHALTDEQSMEEFEAFVLKETAKDIAAGKMYEMTCFKTKQIRKIRLENVINDIKFMRDMEIYRGLCEQVNRLKYKGKASKEEEDHVVAEAVRIYDLYLASRPKLNICPEVVKSMEKQFETGNIGRSLFHDAIIEVYPIVDQWWRKFIASKGRVENFWEKIGSIIKEKRKGKRKTRNKLSSASDLERDGLSLRRKMGKGGRPTTAKQTDVFNMKQTLNFDDDRLHLVFSILNGLRLFLPRSLKAELRKASTTSTITTTTPTSTTTRTATATTRQLMPGVYQIFYELPSLQSDGQAPDGHYDELQLRRMQTFMATSRERRTFPVFIIGGTTYVLTQSFEPGGRQMQHALGKTIHRL